MPPSTMPQGVPPPGEHAVCLAERQQPEGRRGEPTSSVDGAHGTNKMLCPRVHVRFRCGRGGGGRGLT